MESAILRANLVESPPPQPPQHATWQRLLGELHSHRLLLALALILLLVANGFSLLLPLVLGQLIDLFEQEMALNQAELINQYALLLTALFSGQAIFSYGQSYCFALTAEKFIYQLQLKLYKHLQRLPTTFYVQNRVGELSTRFTSDIPQLREIVADDFVGVIAQTMIAIGTLSFMLYLNWQLTLISILSVLLIAGGGTLTLKHVRAAASVAQEEVAAAMGTVEESLTGIVVVKAFVREEYEFQRVAQGFLTAFRANMRRERIQLLLLPMSNIIGFAALTFVIWYGLRQVAAGAASAGTLVAYLAYAGMLTAALSQLSDHFGGLYQGLGAMENVYRLLDSVPANQRQATNTLTQMEGQLCFENVTFRYRDDALPAINNLSFTIEPGEVVAVVGPSGAGKSTLTNLVLAFQQPQNGRIYIDGYPLVQIDPAFVRTQIGIVLQDTHLFSGSVRENIRYGRLDATDEQIEAAACAAYAHEFIIELPQGYDTPVGQRGTALSVGQRQRLCIARALIKQPRFLILDEATSALDSTNETLVQAAIEQLMVGRTTLIIAHRLATVQKANRILVLKQGQLVETGSHQELLEQRGVYYQLYQQQQLTPHSQKTTTG